MKRILIACILLLPMFAAGQTGTLAIEKVQLRANNFYLKTWLYKAGDDSTWARPELNDAGWTLANSLRITDHETQKKLPFKGIGWFRLHFSIDSNTLQNKVVGLKMVHMGASEIFLDGKRIRTFGQINGKDSTEHYQPQNVPFSIPGLTPGEHVLAVRYANYAVDKIEALEDERGFLLTMGYVDNMIDNIYENTANGVFALTLLLGIFAALSFIHLFLYLYHRSNLSNLYFSLFAFSISVWLLSIYITTMSSDVELVTFFSHTLMLSIIFSCFAMSGFNNALFSAKKLRFTIITALCAICIVTWIFTSDIANTATSVLVLIVLLETIFLDIRAIYRKMPGSRIIGFGISFFALFIIICIAFAIINGGIQFEPDSAAAIIFLSLAILAIISIPASISIYLAWSFSRVSKDLSKQLKQVQVLSDKTLQQEQEKQHLLENQKEQLEKEVEVRTYEVITQKEKIQKQHDELKAEKQKSDDLLLNILPAEIAEELKENGTSAAKHFDHVTVLFTDFVDFTKAGERMTPQQLVDELHTCFKAFDEIISRYNIEKIKTIGDAYLAVAGLPLADEAHAANTVKAALDIREFIAERKQRLPDTSFNIRIGIHSGSVVAGIVGVKKFAYDIWGDTVNTAARMEQSSEPGKINISEFTYELVKDTFNCTHRGRINAKNKGEMNMYFVEDLL